MLILSSPKLSSFGPKFVVKFSWDAEHEFCFFVHRPSLLVSDEYHALWYPVNTKKSIYTNWYLLGIMLIPQAWKEDSALPEKKKDKDETARSIRFPKRIWQEIDEDAKRCQRTAVKHMQAIFMAYFNLQDIDLVDMQEVRQRVQAGAVKRGTPRGKKGNKTGTEG